MADVPIREEDLRVLARLWSLPPDRPSTTDERAAVERIIGAIPVHNPVTEVLAEWLFRMEATNSRNANHMAERLIKNLASDGWELVKVR